MTELDLEFFRRCHPLSDEERTQLEKEFDEEEAALRDKVASRTEQQRKQISEAINILFMDNLIAEFGFTRKN